MNSERADLDGPVASPLPEDDRAEEAGLADPAGASAENADGTPSGSVAEAPAQDGVGLGIDIVDIAHMRAILDRTPSFSRRIFSEEERAYCDAAAHPEAHYATRFAAKEAVLKALGTGFSRGIRPRDIEVKRNAKGQPRIALYGAAKAVADELGVVGLPISLSFTHTEAVACAMAITRDSMAAERRRTDPAQELTRQFKKMRGLLDELP